VFTVGGSLRLFFYDHSFRIVIKLLHALTKRDTHNLLTARDLRC
jgi:hypothetical protein